VQTLSHATWRASITSDDLQRMYDQEEKRIFYVAMTRAKCNLVISRSEERYLFGRKRRYQKSGFLDLSNDPKFVAEAISSYDVRISVPASPKAEEGYRSDGRVFQTKSGVLVRSKSEMLLANEFISRGMYFEYEEPADNIMDALPDFTFPDYDGIILEHIGLMSDPEYIDRWEQKAKKYEMEGRRYFRTNEEEIKTLANTVDRLQDQFIDWVNKASRVERVERINLIEKLRRESNLNIGRSIGNFECGVFEIDDTSNQGILAIMVDSNDIFPGVNIDPEKGPIEVDIPGSSAILWEERLNGDINTWVAINKS